MFFFLIINPLIRVTRALLILGVLISSSSFAQDPAFFPQPPELEPAVDFWIKVYTEVDTQSGFLHDSRNLDVIYARLELNRRETDRIRSRIQSDLRILAGGKRNDLTSDQQEILDLWPANVSNDTLRNAANNVRWQLGQSDRFLGGLRRSGAYRSHISQVIAEKGLPIELGVLPHVESSFNPNAYSSASAAGMWQFGRDTARRFMRVDHIVDERMDPYTATGAAMSLLEYNYSVLGTWPLALTAYNHGAGGISRAVRETGSTDIENIVANYRGRRFGFASRNFYAQFLAVIYVENNAQQYFGDFRLDSAPEFQEVVTDAYIDAEVFARSIGVSLEQLQADNAALRPAIWEGNKRIPSGYTIKVRVEDVDARNLLALIPDDFKFEVQTPDVAYTVARGDSLSVIARRFNTTVNRLVALNQLRSRNRISIGQRLLLPQDNIISEQTTAQARGELPADGQYIVRRGDTISLISARYGVSETELLSVNGIEDRNRIYPGQQIRLPGFGTAPDQPETNEATLAELSPDTGRDQSLEDTVQLAVNESGEDILTPAAVLPDHQELEMPVTPEEEVAVAIDPTLDSNGSNEELTEALAADPSDYAVADNNSIEIQASETLGHYADWLGIRAWDLRRLNSMVYRDPVIIGERLTLDFSQINATEFELKRREYHSKLQQEFFDNYRIQSVENYRVQSGDNIATLISRNRYSTPIWLLRQYNPDLDFNRIQIDQEIVFPVLEYVN
ncbi:MAG: hypothetical protein CMQ41_04715 [Gammaproteobacteria bacterium]|nr:hypothetical protein [Gammaproteobacteria bacterium]